MNFSIIKPMGGGLDLLKSSEGYTTCLVQHATVEDLLTLEQQC